jgi:hypothetical protein
MYVGGITIVAICVALSIILNKDKNIELWQQQLLFIRL